MSTELTKDADALICVLYKDYLQKRKDGIPKAEAKALGSSSDIHKNIFPKWIYEDVDETCRELSRAGYLNCMYADDVAWQTALSDEGVIYMENRFKNGLSGVVEYIGKLKGMIPFL